MPKYLARVHFDIGGPKGSGVHEIGAPYRGNDPEKHLAEGLIAIEGAAKPAEPEAAQAPAEAAPPAPAAGASDADAEKAAKKAAAVAKRKATLAAKKAAA